MAKCFAYSPEISLSGLEKPVGPLSPISTHWFPHYFKLPQVHTPCDYSYIRIHTILGYIHTCVGTPSTWNGASDPKRKELNMPKVCREAKLNHTMYGYNKLD